MYTVAHLSDVHLPTPPVPGIRALLNKRLLGYLSWQLRRRHNHRPEVLDALQRDLQIQAPDHIAVTGDLTNISLPAEFRQAAKWLAQLGPPERVTVIPGNHDAYIPLPWAESWSHWASYMGSETAEGESIAHTGFEDFPLVRRRGSVAIVGLTSAIPTKIGMASGSLGKRQAALFKDRLGELDKEGLFRIVLIHHPPIAGTTKPRKSLVDGELFHAAMESAGAELVLHGHDHRFELGDLTSPHGPVPVVGVASASAARATENTPASQYHLYDIERTGDGWTMGWRTREFDAISGRFTHLGTTTVSFQRVPPAEQLDPIDLI